MDLRGILQRCLPRSCTHMFSGRKGGKCVHLLPSPISQFASLDIKFLSFVFALNEIPVAPITCQALVSNCKLRIRAKYHGFEAMNCEMCS